MFGLGQLGGPSPKLNGPMGIPSLFNPAAGQNVLTLSPLGEPLNDYSAETLDLLPVIWHYVYWLSLGTIAVMSGEDTFLMFLLIDIELQQTPDVELKLALSRDWHLFMRNHREEVQKHWAEQTLESAEAKAFLRDIDRILVDKVRKAREYLPRGERMMIHAYRNGDLQTARLFFKTITHIYEVLKQAEDTASWEVARNQLSNGTHGAHELEAHHGAHELEADNGAHELEARHAAHELEAHHPVHEPEEQGLEDIEAGHWYNFCPIV